MICSRKPCFLPFAPDRHFADFVFSHIWNCRLMVGHGHLRLPWWYDPATLRDATEVELGGATKKVERMGVHSKTTDTKKKYVIHSIYTRKLLTCCLGNLKLPGRREKFTQRARMFWIPTSTTHKVKEYRKGPPTFQLIYRRKFRSQISDNMDRWKAEMGRVREKEK